MPSGWEVVATVIIPTGITIGMFALPWLDRSKSRHPAKRQWIIMSGFAAILLIGLMTLKGILETPPEHKKSEATLAGSSDIPKAEATQLESLGE
jgi:quinol-cytochrome oxidoreductase complex cytochrome b subunit